LELAEKLQSQTRPKLEALEECLKSAQAQKGVLQCAESIKWVAARVAEAEAWRAAFAAAIASVGQCLKKDEAEELVKAAPARIRMAEVRSWRQRPEGGLEHHSLFPRSGDWASREDSHRGPSSPLHREGHSGASGASCAAAFAWTR